MTYGYIYICTLKYITCNKFDSNFQEDHVIDNLIDISVGVICTRLWV